MKSPATLLSIRECKLKQIKTSAHQLEQLIINADYIANKKNGSLIH